MRDGTPAVAAMRHSTQQAHTPPGPHTKHRAPTLAHRRCTLPGVSSPARVVRSIIEIARSSHATWFRFFTARRGPISAARRSTALRFTTARCTHPRSSSMPGFRCCVTPDGPPGPPTVGGGMGMLYPPAAAPAPGNGVPSRGVYADTGPPGASVLDVDDVTVAVAEPPAADPVEVDAARSHAPRTALCGALPRRVNGWRAHVRSMLAAMVARVGTCVCECVDARRQRHVARHNSRDPANSRACVCRVTLLACAAVEFYFIRAARN